MHVDCAYDIPVAFESTGFASPVPPFGLMAMAAYGTPAGRTTLIPGEAHDAVLFRLLLQVIDILAVLPLAHALVVVTTTLFATHSIRITHEYGLYSVVFAKIHYPPGSLVAQIPHFPLTSKRQLGPCFAEFSPAAGTFLAAGTLAGDFAQLLAM